MRITAWNLKYHEIVGLEVEVKRHLDPGLEGASGRVIQETSRALLVEVAPHRRLLILKRGALLAFKLPGGGRVVLPGDELLGSPAERVKKLRR